MPFKAYNIRNMRRETYDFLQFLQPWNRSLPLDTSAINSNPTFKVHPEFTWKTATFVILTLNSPMNEGNGKFMFPKFANKATIELVLSRRLPEDGV